MKRRDFVRALVTASLAPKFLAGQQASRANNPAAGPIPWTRGLNSETPLPITEPAVEIAQSDLVFFSPLQMNTLQRLSDVLMPAVGARPGALKAKTPEFLDFLIGSSSEERKKSYSLGLDWLETSAQNKFKKPFAQLEADQADELLKQWLSAWMTDHPPSEPHAGFLSVAHDDIRNATINSTAWKTADAATPDETTQESLYWSPIEPDVYEDSARHGGTLTPAAAAAKAAKGMPVYRR